MTSHRFWSEVKALAERSFSRKLEEVDTVILRKGINEWDSLSHLLLIMSIEENFDIQLSKADVDAIESLKDICRLIEERKQA